MISKYEEIMVGLAHIVFLPESRRGRYNELCAYDTIFSIGHRQTKSKKKYIFMQKNEIVEKIDFFQ